MSSALGIAAVTTVLRNLLDNGMIDEQVVSTVGNVKVTARAPDLIPLDPNAPSQLNLFLYRVTANQGWRNVGQPSRDASGKRITNPPMALDLHYLLTAYAAQDLHTEILLGYGMQVLHETPVLSRDGIRRALNVPGLVTDPDGSLPNELMTIQTSGLADQVELIKIVPEAMSTDEVSKLWSAFQSRYRPSSAFQISVVLIESDRSTRDSLPVRERKLYVVPFLEPVVDEVLAREGPGEEPRSDLQILARHELVVRGSNLRGEHTLVQVGAETIRPGPARIDDVQIELTLPSGLRAGIQGVQVVHERLMGEPPTLHRGVSSNVASFVLHPEIVAPPSLPAADTMRLQVDPAVDPTQEVLLLLNEQHVPTSPPAEALRPRAYSFPATPSVTSPPGPTHHVDVRFHGVAPGTYLVRVRVDGAVSPLGVDGSGHYASPSVVIP